MSKLYEEVNPFQFTAKGIMNVDDASVRDNINSLLTGTLMSCTLTPYIALEKVRKVLSYFHIFPPAVPFMEGDRGVHVFDVNQYGLKYGMKNDGQVVNFNSVAKDLTHGSHMDGENFNSSSPPETKDTNEKFFIYFEYKQNEKGLFDVFSEIVTQDELDDLVNAVEDDINDDDVEDDRDERLDESLQEASHESEKLGRKATRQAVTGNIMKGLGLKGMGGRLVMRSHLTSRRADDAEASEDAASAKKNLKEDALIRAVGILKTRNDR